MYVGVSQPCIDIAQQMKIYRQYMYIQEYSFLFFQEYINNKAKKLLF